MKMATTRPEVAAARIDAIRNEFHPLNEHEIEAGFTVQDLTTRAECNRAVTMLNGDINRINGQIGEARLAHAKGWRQLDNGWLARAQSAIRWKRNLVRTIRAKAEEMPLPPKPSKQIIVERRAIILDVIQEDIGDEAMKRYVAVAKERRPDLFVAPGAVDNGETGETGENR